jgi:hypothetical protein
LYIMPRFSRSQADDDAGFLGDLGREAGAQSEQRLGHADAVTQQAAFLAEVETGAGWAGEPRRLLLQKPDELTELPLAARNPGLEGLVALHQLFVHDRILPQERGRAKPSRRVMRGGYGRQS